LHAIVIAAIQARELRLLKTAYFVRGSTPFARFQQEICGPVLIAYPLDWAWGSIPDGRNATLKGFVDDRLSALVRVPVSSPRRGCT